MTRFSRNRSRKGTSGERGQSLLELMPVIGLMLILTFGVIDTSRAIWQLEVITGLTREGSNIASRTTDSTNGGVVANALTTATNAVISDGQVLNLSTTGQVIVTAVQNQSGKMVITGQLFTGALNSVSKIGNGVNSTATLPATNTTIPNNGTVYVTEIYSSFSPITPLGAFISYTMPSTLYDAAYF